MRISDEARVLLSRRFEVLLPHLNDRQRIGEDLPDQERGQPQEEEGEDPQAQQGGKKRRHEHEDAGRDDPRMKDPLAWLEYQRMVAHVRQVKGGRCDRLANEVVALAGGGPGLRFRRDADARRSGHGGGRA